MNQTEKSPPSSNIYDIVLACMEDDDTRGWTPFFHFLRPLADKIAHSIGGEFRQDALEEFPTFATGIIYDQRRRALRKGIPADEARDPVSQLRLRLEKVRSEGGDEDDAARALLYTIVDGQMIKKQYIRVAKRRWFKSSEKPTQGEDATEAVAKTQKYLQRISIGAKFYSNGEEFRVDDQLARKTHEHWAVEQREDPDRLANLKERWQALRPLIAELRDIHRVPLRLRHYPVLMELEDCDLAYLAARQAGLSEEERLFDATTPITAIREEVVELLGATAVGRDATPHDVSARLLAMSVNTTTVNVQRAAKQLIALRKARHVD